MTSLEVREARGDELPAIRRLTFEAYGEYRALMTPSAWAGLEAALRGAFEAAGAAERIVAVRDGRLVGSVLLFPPAADAYAGAAARAACPEVRLLAVLPEARGQGIGRALMDECVRRAHRLGARELGLHTSASMRVAIGLYERMGFERTPELDFQPPGAELVAAYRLRI